MEHLNYHFKDIIGKGGMSTVYLGQHKTLLKPVAIKVLNTEYITNANIRKRFLDEARNMFSMSHNNIIRSTDLIDQNDIVAFVMEYIQGKTIKQLLEEKGKLEDFEIILIFSQMISAVNYIHEQGLIHRDIKPSNFMINEKMEVKLMDFGIAKDLNINNSDNTNTTLNMGTTMYMSPEQIRSTRDVTNQSDIYSLGVLLWQMVTGSRPYELDTLSTFDIQVKIVNEALPLTKTSWDEIIQKATEKNIEKRYKSCKDINIDDFIKINNQVQPNTPFQNVIIDIESNGTYIQKINEEIPSLHQILWYKKVGEYIKKNEAIIRIESSKNSFEITSNYEGYITARSAVSILKVGDILIQVSVVKNINNKISEKITKWIRGVNNLDEPLYGCIDQKGNWILEPFLDDVPYFDSNNIAQIEYNEKWGFINKNGLWKIKPMFEHRTELINGFYYVTFDDKKGIINKDGEWIIQPIIDELEEFLISSENTVVKINNQWSFINKSGDFINNINYDEIETIYIREKEWDKYQILMFYKKENKWGIINRNGVLVTNAIFDSIENNGFEDIIRFKINNLWGILNLDGKETIKAQYDLLQPVYGIRKFKKASINNCTGIINEHGDWVIRPIRCYDIDFKNLEHNYLCASILMLEDQDEESEEVVKWGIIDQNGNWLCKPIFNSLEIINASGVFIAQDENENEGIIDLNGFWLIKPELEAGSLSFWHDNLDSFSELMYCTVEKDGKWGVISNEGKWILNNEFDKLGDTEELLEKGIIKFEKNGKNGWIDKNGVIRIPAIYEEIYSYGGFLRQKLAQVKIDEQWGFIDIKGNWVLQPILTDPSFFNDSNQVAIATIKDKSKGFLSGIININGAWIVEPIYSEINEIIKINDDTNYFTYSKINEENIEKRGISNLNGDIVIAPDFDCLVIDEDDINYIIAYKDGKDGIINYKGLWITEPIYDSLHSFDDDGHAKAYIDGKYGFIDKHGAWLIEPILEDVEEDIDDYTDDDTDEEGIDEDDLEEDESFDPRTYFQELTGFFSSTFIAPKIPIYKINKFTSFFNKEFIDNCEFYVLHEENENGYGLAIVKKLNVNAWFLLINIDKNLCEGFCINGAAGWKKIENIYLEDSNFMPYIFVKYNDPVDNEIKVVNFTVGITGKIKKAILRMWNENFK